MNLSDAFTSVAIKQIAQVDIPFRGSNQHELNGTSQLRRFFKTAERLKSSIEWHYFADGKDVVRDSGTLTFYDARQKSAARTGRSEWRGYYNGDFLSVASPGDVLLLARTHDRQLHGMLFEAGSNWLRSAMHLLNLDELTLEYQVLEKELLQKEELQLAEQLILDELGVAVALSAAPADQDLMVATFGKKIPNTRTLASFAREQVNVDITDPDSALMKWIERETALFFALERVLVQERLDRGFDTVEDFLQYSISIQQSRKARMGLSLQHHLGAVFAGNGLRFAPQAQTERKNRPDFIFPGEKEYRDPTFDQNHLTMLGAKSTAKERWRQILAEADRITHKHLFTLEPGISADQTDEMDQQRVQLVIPKSLLDTYSMKQQKWLWTLENFVEAVRKEQVLIG